MSEKGHIASIYDFQLIQNIWQLQVNGDEELTPASRISRMLEEVEEVKEAAQQYNGTKGSTERLGGEVADVIFVALGVLSVLGIDAESELNRIMATNAVKYNPVNNTALRANGMNHRQAMAHQKRIYTHGKK